MISLLVDKDESFNVKIISIWKFIYSIFCFLKISFDELTYYRYEKRDSLQNVKQINVYGNLTLKSVKIIHTHREGYILNVKTSNHFLFHFL